LYFSFLLSYMDYRIFTFRILFVHMKSFIYSLLDNQSFFFECSPLFQIIFPKLFHSFLFSHFTKTLLRTFSFILQGFFEYLLSAYYLHLSFNPYFPVGLSTMNIGKLFSLFFHFHIFLKYFLRTFVKSFSFILQGLSILYFPHIICMFVSIDIFLLDYVR